ncbi:MAG: DegV family protein [Clostridiales bacterium]|nr:DegV family protein [Clostridiales bacterium]
MKIAISTESTADLTKEIIIENDFKIIAYPILLGETSGFDGEITTRQIIDFVNENKVLPKTSAVNDFRFTEHFGNLLKDYDAVIHFALSSELSATYNNAVRASQNFKNVYVVDTRSLSTGIGLLALYAKQLVNKGMTAKEIYDLCLKRVPYIQASFELKRLDYLYKGGRCNALTLFGANLLKIRPQIIVSDGKMIPGKKYRGNYAHVVKSYCQDVLEKFNNPDLTTAFVTYTTADDDIVLTAREYLSERGFKNIYVTRAGATITSHCGEDCLGILYINDGGVND